MNTKRLKELAGVQLNEIIQISNQQLAEILFDVSEMFMKAAEDYDEDRANERTTQLVYNALDKIKQVEDQI